MLVISRKVQETVVITAADGTEIRLKVVRCDDHSVRLAFDAPLEVMIDRLEVHEEKWRLLGCAGGDGDE